MPDSPLTDAEVLDEAPRQFAKLLQSVAQGHVLWHPTCLPHGQHMIGDCGFVDGGEFTRLYNVFDDQHPPGVDPLPRFEGDIEILRETNVKNTLQSRSIHEMEFSPNVDLSAVVFIPPSSLKIRTALQMEKEDVAFLTLYGPTRVVAKYRQTRKLENYLAEHAAQIVDHYKNSYPVKAHYLMLIYRTTASASWFGGYTSRKRLEIGTEVSVYGAGGEVKLAHARSSAWSLTHGEPSWDNESPPEHCVILRAVRCRWRDQLHNRARAFAKPFVNLFRSPGPSTPGESDVPQDLPGEGSHAPSGIINSPTHGTGTTDSEIQSGPEEDDDLLDALLDVVLESHPDVDCVVGNWDTIAAFLEEYGHFPEGWQRRRLVVPVIEKDHGQAGGTAHLLSIHPRETTIFPESENTLTPTMSGADIPPTPRAPMPPIHTDPEETSPYPSRQQATHPRGQAVQFSTPPSPRDLAAGQAYPTPRSYLGAPVTPEYARIDPQALGNDWFIQFPLHEGLRQKLRSICKSVSELWTNATNISFDKLFPYLSELRAAPKDAELAVFCNILQAHYEQHRPRIEELKKNKQIEYHYLQEIYQPGAQIIVRRDTTQSAVVVSSEFRGFMGFRVYYRRIEGTTKELHWTTGSVVIDPFSGPVDHNGLNPSPASVRELAQRTDSGRKFLKLMENGGLFQVKILGMMYPERLSSSSIFVSGLGMSDPNHGEGDSDYQGKLDSDLEERLDGTTIRHDDISEDIHWLLPSRVECFSFVEERWGMVSVSDIQRIHNNEKAWDRLILDSKEIIRAAFEAHSDMLPSPTILLHGPAGVGKTFTAEMLAETLGRPLYRSKFYKTFNPSSSDTSTLNFMLNSAERWNAVLLLDDLDMDDEETIEESMRYLLRADARRKIPVILIARRVSAVPYSVLERVTLSFEYRNPDFECRAKMWRLFTDEAKQYAGRETGLALDEGALNELAERPLTPLAIKEVIQTAMALANARGETPALGRFVEVADRKAQSLKDADASQLQWATDDSLTRPSSVWNWLRFVAQGFA